jgi:hypothetical protein
MFGLGDLEGGGCTLLHAGDTPQSGRSLSLGWNTVHAIGMLLFVSLSMPQTSRASWLVTASLC